MSRLGRWITFLTGVVFLISAVIWLFLWFAFRADDVPSNIDSFAPSSFPATAQSKFFYSVGNELKYSDHIDPSAPTLLRGRIDRFLVSPGGTEIAVVVNGELIVCGTESILRRVTAVDSIYHSPKPVGRSFFRDDDFQWSKDTKSLYLIRDEFYGSKGSQLFSEKGELWRYEIESGSLQLVLRPFKGYSYFFGSNGIYFSESTDRGDLQLKYFDGVHTTLIADPNAADIRLKSIRHGVQDKPFFSFSIFDYQKALQSSMGVEMTSSGIGPETLVINGLPYLKISEGQGLKGPYYCDEMLRSVFLPGGQYFLLNVPYCGNYHGQLLIEGSSGRYSTLPSDTVVYLTLNTETYRKYRVTAGGIEAE